MENGRMQRFSSNWRNPTWLWASPTPDSANISPQAQQKRWYHVQCTRTALAATGILWLYHQWTTYNCGYRSILEITNGSDRSTRAAAIFYLVICILIGITLLLDILGAFLERLSAWQRSSSLPKGIVFFALKGCEETLKFMDIYYASRATQIASCIDGILGPIHGLTIGPSYDILANVCSAQFDAGRALALAQYLCNMFLTYLYVYSLRKLIKQHMQLTRSESNNAQDYPLQPTRQEPQMSTATV